MAITITHSHRIAFSVRYIAPTNTRGARVKAVHPNAPEYSLTMAYHTDTSYDDCAKAFCEKMGWPGNLIRGDDKHGAHYIFDDSAEMLAELLVWMEENGMTKTPKKGNGTFSHEGTEYEIISRAKAMIQ